MGPRYPAGVWPLFWLVGLACGFAALVAGLAPADSQQTLPGLLREAYGHVLLRCCRGVLLVVLIRSSLRGAGVDNATLTDAGGAPGPHACAASRPSAPACIRRTLSLCACYETPPTCAVTPAVLRCASAELNAIYGLYAGVLC